jgi:ElaB/YqjD/DUF883 family membrane-anchored ribosome-binding protein
MQRTRSNHRDDRGETMDALRDRVGIMGATVRDIGEIVKEAVTEKLTSLRDDGKDRVAAAKEDLEERIGSKPLTAVFVAAGVGLLFGLFMRRR